MKIISINVNGLKAFYEKGAFDRLIQQFNPDILCLQETKCSESNVGYWIADYNYQYIPFCNSNHWKHGYAGVATLVKEGLNYGVTASYSLNPMDEYGEGRIKILDLVDFYLVNVYTLNSGDKDDLRMAWDEKFYNIIKEFQKRKPVVIVGDLNVVPNYLDYWGNYDLSIDSMPGLKTYEINGFNMMCNDLNLVDSFRHLHPTDRAFSWYSYRGGARAQNKGWRIDFALVSRSFMNHVTSSQVHSQFEGSDHCPISIELQ